MKPQGTTGVAAGIVSAEARPFSPTLMRVARAILRYYPVALIFVLWEICSRVGLFDPIFVPPLSEVLKTLYEEPGSASPWPQPSASRSAFSWAASARSRISSIR